jgi:S1-C subfamily serine protease
VTTTYVVLTSGGDLQSGSGFLIHAVDLTGIIVTNEHVVRDVGGQARFEVVFQSGTGPARRVRATTVGRNAEADLAFMKVAASKLPVPIALAAGVRRLKRSRCWSATLPGICWK